MIASSSLEEDLILQNQNGLDATTKMKMNTKTKPQRMQTRNSKKRAALEDVSNKTETDDQVSNVIGKENEEKNNKNNLPQKKKRRTSTRGKRKSVTKKEIEDHRVVAGKYCPWGYHSLPLPPGIYDIDAKHGNDPAYLREYVKDIFSYLRSLQYKYALDPTLIEAKQPKVTDGMRAILVDWLVEVADEFMLCADTFYLGINYLDRFLQEEEVNRSQLQLVGATCLLLAAKYEEIYAPSIEEFVIVCDHTYKKEEVLKMEGRILNALRFKLTVSTVKNFLRRFQRASRVQSTEKCLCNYLCELGIVQLRCRQFSPSMLAASSLFLARFMLYGDDNDFNNSKVWDKTLEHYTGYEVPMMANCIHFLHLVQVKAWAENMGAVYAKYDTKPFEYVADLEPVDRVHLPKVTVPNKP